MNETPGGLQPQRWRDAPENQALVRQAIDTGAMTEQRAGDTLDFHEHWGTDPTKVFVHAIRSQARTGLPAPDTSKYPASKLEPFESDILDRIIGGEIKTTKVV